MAKPDVEYMAMFFFEEVAQASDLTTAVVFGRLYALVGSDNQQPFLNIEAMAGSCNVSRYTIMRCLKNLVAMKLISRHRNGGETYRYMVHFDQLRQLITLQKSTLKSATSNVEICHIERCKFQHAERCKDQHLNSDVEKGTQREEKSEPTPSKPTPAYLESANEVMTKMGEWINKNRERHPVLDSVDVAMEADGLYLKYRTKKVDADALVDTWMRQIVSARETKQATVAYSGKAPVMSIRDGAQKDGVELDRVFGFMDDLKQAYLEVKHDA